MNNKYGYGYIGVITEAPIEWEYFSKIPPHNCTRAYALSQLGYDTFMEWNSNERYCDYTSDDILSLIVSNEEDYCKELYDERERV